MTKFKAGDKVVISNPQSGYEYLKDLKATIIRVHTIYARPYVINVPCRGDENENSDYCFNDDELTLDETIEQEFNKMTKYAIYGAQGLAKILHQYKDRSWIVLSTGNNFLAQNQYLAPWIPSVGDLVDYCGNSYRVLGIDSGYVWCHNALGYITLSLTDVNPIHKQESE